MIRHHVGMRALAVAAAVGFCAAAGPRARAAEPKWLGDDLPLPLSVKTPQDIGFKAAAERQYLIFNLMAGGKLAFDRGDYAGAAEKWETLLRIPGLDPQIERSVQPLLDEARVRAGRPTQPRTEPVATPGPAPGAQPAAEPAAHEQNAPVRRQTTTVAGTVSGGGPSGPGGAVVWLKRLDEHGPRPAPAQNQIVTQREKTFLPHVLAVPVGTSVQFRNDDRIYHNVFSIAKPNEFDGGIRATGATYVKTFSQPGVVQLLCNIHATMSAFVVVVDSP